MNIYLLRQNAVRGYDTYDSCVVVADSEEEAKNIHPRGCLLSESSSSTWPRDPSQITCELIGYTVSEVNFMVICASFNAG